MNTLELYKKRNGRFQVRLRAGNGIVILEGIGKGHSHKSSARKTAKSIRSRFTAFEDLTICKKG